MRSHLGVDSEAYPESRPDIIILIYVEYKYHVYINIAEDIIYVLVTLLIIILAYRWVSWIRSCGCGIVLVGGATKVIRLTAMHCYFIALKEEL